MSIQRKKAVVALEDGTLFSGFSHDQEGTFCGEVIFTTSMSGYQEVLSDPSYAHQIVVFTCPHVGNTGITCDDDESSRCWVSGLIVKELSKIESSWRSTHTFHSFRASHSIPVVYGVDTRSLTIHLREKGSQKGCIAIGDISPEEAVSLARGYRRPDYHVSTSVAYSLEDSNQKTCQFSVCVVDFGVKRAILRSLVSLGCRVTVVPPFYPAQDILALGVHGVVLSNGPGDPQENVCALQTIKALLEKRVPLLGICLGCQLLALSANAATVKMKHGHHGTNHPVFDLKRQKVSITSQNHDFMISEELFPDCLEITHRSLVDRSVEGIRFRTRPAFGFQGHPEGGPGPQDIDDVFHEFVSLMSRHV